MPTDYANSMRRKYCRVHAKLACIIGTFAASVNSNFLYRIKIYNGTMTYKINKKIRFFFHRFMYLNSNANVISILFPSCTNTFLSFKRPGRFPNNYANYSGSRRVSQNHRDPTF